MISFRFKLFILFCVLFEFQDKEAAREKWKDLRISQIEYAAMNYKGKYHTLGLILIVLGE